MHLFVHNARLVVLPCETEIDALLTEDLVLASKHFVTNQLTFEAQVRFGGPLRVRQAVCRGTSSVGSSRRRTRAPCFTDVLAGALSTDYTIPVERVGVQSAIGSRDLDLAILQNAAKTRATSPFETIARLSGGSVR
jgi:hypothetical protein